MQIEKKKGKKINKITGSFSIRVLSVLPVSTVGAAGRQRGNRLWAEYAIGCVAKAASTTSPQSLLPRTTDVRSSYVKPSLHVAHALCY